MRTGFVAVLMILSFNISPSYALEKPSVETLTAELESQIPPYWAVKKAVIIASVNTGDAVEPNIKQRFEASVTPASDLYVKDPGSVDAFAPYIPIVPTVAAAEARTLYGIARSTYSAGEWMTRLELENHVAGLGKPRGMFAGPTLIRGSEREAKVTALLADNIAREIKRQAQSQIEAQEAAYQSRLRALEAAQAKALDEARAQYAAEKREFERKQQKHASRKRKFEWKLKGMKAAHQAQLERNTERNQAELKALEVAQQAEIKRAKEVHQAALTNLEDKQARELALLREKHRAGLEQLKLEHEQKMQRVDIEYAQKAEALKRKIKGTGELIALQKKKRQKETALAVAQAKVLTARIVCSHKV